MTRYLPDVNVWLACALSGHPHHDAARDWLDGVADSDSVLFCRQTQLSLLRLLTTSAVLAPMGDPPLTNAEAWAVYDAFAADPRIAQLLVEPATVGPTWRTHSALTSPSPKRWMDALLAALAITTGAVLVTTDAAFSSYPDLEPLLLRR